MNTKLKIGKLIISKEEEAKNSIDKYAYYLIYSVVA